MDENQNEVPLTFGEKAVGLTFNPGGNLDVDNCKRTFAKAIDQLHSMRSGPDVISSDKARLIAIAITELQGAQMWAVKAITWKD